MNLCCRYYCPRCHYYLVRAFYARRRKARR
jgi:hypothetical protein